MMQLLLVLLTLHFSLSGPGTGKFSDSSRSSFAVNGVGEAAGGAVLTPASGGVTAIAVVHGADATGTAINRLWAGPGVVRKMPVPL